MFNLMPWSKGKEGEHPVHALRKNMEQIFEDFFQNTQSMGLFPSPLMKSEFIPQIDVVESEKEIQVNVELPGMTEKDIEVNLEKNALSIKGQKKQEEEQKGNNYHYVERRYGSFYRSIPLPVDVDPEKIEANFKNGILKITLPKAKKEEAKKISIKTN